MKLAVSGRMNATASELKDEGRETMVFEHNDLIQIEMNALAEAFKDEELKLSKEKEMLRRKEDKLKERKQRLNRKTHE